MLRVARRGQFKSSEKFANFGMVVDNMFENIVIKERKKAARNVNICNA